MCGPGHVNERHSGSRPRGGQASGQGTRHLAWSPGVFLRCSGPPSPTRGVWALPCPASSGCKPAALPAAGPTGSRSSCWVRSVASWNLGPLNLFPHLQSGWPVHVTRNGGPGESRQGLRELGGRRLLHGMHSNGCPAVPKHQEAVYGAELYSSNRVLRGARWTHQTWLSPLGAYGRWQELTWK